MAKREVELYRKRVKILKEIERLLKIERKEIIDKIEKIKNEISEMEKEINTRVVE